MKNQKCRLCGAEHRLDEKHQWPGSPLSVVISPKPQPEPEPRPLSDNRAKVVHGLKEAIDVTAGLTQSAKTTIIYRDKAKHAASERKRRAVKKLLTAKAEP